VAPAAPNPSPEGSSLHLERESPAAGRPGTLRAELAPSLQQVRALAWGSAKQGGPPPRGTHAQARASCEESPAAPLERPA
jgi:hypothetical protein